MADSIAVTVRESRKKRAICDVGLAVWPVEITLCREVGCKQKGQSKLLDSLLAVVRGLLRGEEARILQPLELFQARFRLRL
jgi:hypothetical protein